MSSYCLENENATRKLGAYLSQYVQAGDCIALTGNLGAGKTTFARGFIEAVSGVSDVPSPTYTLVQTYETKAFEIWHCDLYRLDRPDDVLELGLLDAFEDCVCLIEWPERAGGYLPKDCKTVHIEFETRGRRVRFTNWPNDLEMAQFNA